MQVSEQSQTPTSNKLLRPEEVAERWGIPLAGVWRLAREGRLDVVRIGRRIGFRPQAVEAFERTGGALAMPREDHARVERPLEPCGSRPRAGPAPALTPTVRRHDS